MYARKRSIVNGFQNTEAAGAGLMSRTASSHLSHQCQILIESSQSQFCFSSVFFTLSVWMHAMYVNPKCWLMILIKKHFLLSTGGARITVERRNNRKIRLSQSFHYLDTSRYFRLFLTFWKKTQGPKNSKLKKKNSITQGKNSRFRQTF